MFDAVEDLFESDDFFNEYVLSNNDELLLTESNSTEIVCLNCTGEDSLVKLTFHKNGFIKNNNFKHRRSSNGTANIVHNNVKLFQLEFHTDAFINDSIINVLFNKVRMNIQMLIIASREDSKMITNQTMLELRMEVTKFLTIVKNYSHRNELTTNIDGQLKNLRLLLNSISNLPMIKIIHTVHSTEGNKCSSAAFHLLHGNLEWRWLILLIILDLEMCKCAGDGEDVEKINHLKPPLYNTEFEQQLQLLLFDLCVLSICKFQKLKSIDLIYNSTFSCQCIKELWLLIQLLIEQLSENDQIKTFWHYFNKTIDDIRTRHNPYINYIQINSIQMKYNFTQSNWLFFSLWHLNGILKLHVYNEDGEYNSTNNQRINENYELLNTLTKSLLSTTEQSEELLRVYLYIIIPIITEWWPYQSDIIMLFWEYFHRNLNSSFFVVGSSISSLAVVGNSVSEYLEQIRLQLEIKKLNPNQTSYSLFIYLLGKSVKRIQKNQIDKIMGRIYSKFTANKLEALSEIGLHNIITLLLTVALNCDLKEMAQRIQNFLLQISFRPITNACRIILAKGHCSLILLYFENKINISDYVRKLLELTEGIQSNDELLTVSRCLAECTQIILNRSEYFNVGEPSLLDTTWIIRYLSLCVVSEQNRMLKCINGVLMKMTTLSNQYTTLQSSNCISTDIELNHLQKCLNIIYEIFLPFIKNAYGKSTNISDIIPEIAANLCLCTTLLKNNGHHQTYMFYDLFKYFHDVNCHSIETTIKFLTIVFSSDKLNTIEQSLVIRSWIKCLTLSTSHHNYKDLKTLTNIVVGLEEFRVMCDVETSIILDSNEPLYTFFAEIGKSYQHNTDFKKKYLIVEKVQKYLLSFEKWEIEETSENLSKIYGIIGVIFLNCSQIIYVRGKSTCFFNIAIFHYILPTTLLTGKPPAQHTAQIVHKIWHLLIIGIEKLDYKNDLHLQKILNDLIIKWLPYFKFGTNLKLITKPYVYCIKECSDQLAMLIIEKIANNYLNLQRRQPNSMCNFVITILSEIITAISDNEDKLIIIVKTIILILFEHAVMVDETSASRKMTFILLERLFSNKLYQSSDTIKDIISTNLKLLTKNRISYYSSFYFEFLSKFVKINPNAIQNLMEYIREEIDNVEKLRGIGRDGKLRSQYQQLQGELRAAQKV